MQSKFLFLLDTCQNCMKNIIYTYKCVFENQNKSYINWTCTIRIE
jgi:hypothetical protein